MSSHETKATLQKAEYHQNWGLRENTAEARASMNIWVIENGINLEDSLTHTHYHTQTHIHIDFGIQVNRK